MPPLSSKLLEQVLDDYLTPQIKEKILNKIQLVRERNKTQSICLKKKNIKQSKQSKQKSLTPNKS
jgi:hypothetical protein